MKLLRNLSNNVLTGFDYTPGSSGSSIPSESRRSVYKLAEYLRTVGTYTETQTNTIVATWLILEGQPKQHLNDMLYSYLGSLGYEGSLQGRLVSWSEDT